MDRSNPNKVPASQQHSLSKALSGRSLVDIRRFEKWTVPYQQLIFETPLGEGCLGVVYKGKYVRGIHLSVYCICFSFFYISADTD